MESAVVRTPLHNDGMTPTPLELRLRFACGAAFGALLVGGVFQSAANPSIPGLALVAAAGGLCCGRLARRSGDRFWFALRRWWL